MLKIAWGACLQAAQLRADEHNTAQLLTHQLAVNCATRVLTGWQQMLRANSHWRQHTLQGSLRFWAWWAPDHRARNAGKQGEQHVFVYNTPLMIASLRIILSSSVPGVIGCPCYTAYLGDSTAQQYGRFLCALMLAAGWRAAAQELAARKLARCFYCWRWYCQVRLLREVAFQNKQRAIREALAIGEQVARRRKAALLASSFMAWHVQVGAAQHSCVELHPDPPPVMRFEAACTLF